MTFLKLFNVQGIVGLVCSAALAILLVMAKTDARQWKAESGRFEQLFHGEQTAHAVTIANYRAAAEAARQADAANAARVMAEQRQINERSTDDLQNRLTDARARADGLRRQLAQAATDSSGGNAAPVPELPQGAERPAKTADDRRLSLDERLIATEQAIQLDELIKWVKRQTAVVVSSPPPAK